MKFFLIIAAYGFCLLLELPSYFNDERKKLILYCSFMLIAFLEALAVVYIKDIPSIASIIEKVFGPISKKIYG